jgi:hypothetical protein
MVGRATMALSAAAFGLGGGVITSPQKDREKQFFLIYLFLTSRFAAINWKTSICYHIALRTV